MAGLKEMVYEREDQVRKCWKGSDVKKRLVCERGFSYSA
jgi:hypothetical protein